MSALNPLRSAVMSLPEEDRLPYALGLLDSMAGLSEEGKQVSHLQTRFELTHQEALFVTCLMARPGETRPKEVILACVTGPKSEASYGLLNVIACKVRAKLDKAGFDRTVLRTVHGHGFSLNTKACESLRVGEPA